jgi:hypothetical protein
MPKVAAATVTAAVEYIQPPTQLPVPQTVQSSVQQSSVQQSSVQQSSVQPFVQPPVQLPVPPPVQLPLQPPDQQPVPQPVSSSSQVGGGDNGAGAVDGKDSAAALLIANPIPELTPRVIPVPGALPRGGRNSLRSTTVDISADDLPGGIGESLAFMPPRLLPKGAVGITEKVTDRGFGIGAMMGDDDKAGVDAAAEAAAAAYMQGGGGDFEKK